VRRATQKLGVAAGFRAASLTAQTPAERDSLGRVLVDRDLRVPRGITRCVMIYKIPCIISY
jgi:hypothetical protein